MCVAHLFSRIFLLAYPPRAGARNFAKFRVFCARPVRVVALLAFQFCQFAKNAGSSTRSTPITTTTNDPLIAA
uniref:Secreted protein n=1 Tax=Trichogramma kaykai TaxID=54128 RepID=A0ABD2WPK1_9HYME